MNTFYISYPNATVRINCTDSTDLQWLLSYFNGEQRTLGLLVDYTINLERSDELHQHLWSFFGDGQNKQQFPAFNFDTHTIYLPLCGLHNHAKVYFDKEFNSFYLVDDNEKSIRVIGLNGRFWVRNAVANIVLEIIAAQHLIAPYIIMHAAALMFNQKAILICGPKNSGKSSLLIHMLQEAEAVLSNDRTIVELCQNDESIHACATGIPTLIKLRRGVRSLFPDFFSHYPDNLRLASMNPGEMAKANPERTYPSDDGRILMHPQQFSSLFGLHYAHTSNVAAIVFPQVQADENLGIHISRLEMSKGRQSLLNGRFRASTEEYKGSIFLPDNYHTSISLAAAQESQDKLIDTMLTHIPLYTCLLGKKAYQRSEQINEILTRICEI